MDRINFSEPWFSHPLNEGYINTHLPKFLGRNKQGNPCKTLRTISNILWSLNTCWLLSRPPPPSTPSWEVTFNAPLLHANPHVQLVFQFSSPFSSLIHIHINPNQSLCCLSDLFPIIEICHGVWYPGIWFSRTLTDLRARAHGWAGKESLRSSEVSQDS